MAKVTYTGMEENFRHTCPSGSGKMYVFQRGWALDIADLQDIQHYLSSGGFKVELTPVEAAELKVNEVMKPVIEKSRSSIIDKITPKKKRR